MPSQWRRHWNQDRKVRLVGLIQGFPFAIPALALLAFWTDDATSFKPKAFYNGRVVVISCAFYLVLLYSGLDKGAWESYLERIGSATAYEP